MLDRFIHKHRYWLGSTFQHLAILVLSFSIGFGVCYALVKSVTTIIEYEWHQGEANGKIIGKYYDDGRPVGRN